VQPSFLEPQLGLELLHLPLAAPLLVDLVVEHPRALILELALVLPPPLLAQTRALEARLQPLALERPRPVVPQTQELVEPLAVPAFPQQVPAQLGPAQLGPAQQLAALQGLLELVLHLEQAQVQLVVQQPLQLALELALLAQVSPQLALELVLLAPVLRWVSVQLVPQMVLVPKGH